MKKLLLCAAFFLIGVTISFAEAMERSVTYNVSNTGELTVTGLEPPGSVAEFNNTYGGITGTDKNHMTSGHTATFKVKNYDGYIIKGLTMRMRSITNAGAGTFYFKIGNSILAEISPAKTFDKWYNNNNYTIEQTDINVTLKNEYVDGYKVGENEELEIKISATVNSLYIYGYTIIYEKPSDLVDMPRITPTKGDIFYRKQQINISCEADVDAIYFTTDGTEPTTASQKYDENIPVYIENTVVKAFAIKGNKQTKVTTKTFTKKYPKAITAYSNNDYFGMTAESSDKSHLIGKKVSVYDNTVLCDSKDFMDYAFLLNYQNGTIQYYKNNYFLNYQSQDNVNISIDKESNKKVWLLTDDGKMYQNINTKRRISFSNTYKYFGTFSETTSIYVDAYSLDLIKGYTRDSLSPNKIGTICLPHDVLNDDRNGATYYNIVGKKTENGSVTSLILEEETGMLVAGRPYIFEASDNALCCMYLDIAESDNAAPASNHNGLYGSLERTGVYSGMYLISNNEIVKCGENCSIAANRAYINMADVPEINDVQQMSGRMLAISIGGSDSTNIKTAERENTNNSVIYNMQGQRVVAPSKGVYIVNGKKTIIK